MKYVLVIDVPEPLESKDVKIDYLCYYHCGNIIEDKIDVFLKPLPQKMTMEKALKMERVGAIRDIYTTWNACLEEITGDTKKEAE